MLTRAGYRVTSVGNGEEAVVAASKEPFDLFILDAVMTVLSGREAYERIRAKHPDARFLFTSGYGGDALPAAFLTDLSVDMIAKPFDPDMLLRAVRVRLDRGVG